MTDRTRGNFFAGEAIVCNVAPVACVQFRVADRIRGVCSGLKDGSQPNDQKNEFMMMMIPKPISLLAIGCFAAVLAGCSNPADNVPQASVENVDTNVSNASVGAAADTPVAGAKSFVFTSASKIGFIGSKVTGSHDGGFERFAGQLTLANGAVEGGQVNVTIDMTSLWSDNDRLTGHLKGTDFFDVQTIPTATFESTSIEKSADGYTVTGNLNLHGVEKSISFSAQVTLDGDKVTVVSEFSINRFDFDIKYPGKSDDLIRKEVVIKLDLVGEPGQADFDSVQAAASAAMASMAPPGRPSGRGGRGGGGFDREAMMQRFDTNKDGQLDDTERAAMRTEFGNRGGRGGGRPGGGPGGGGGRPGAGDRPPSQ